MKTFNDLSELISLDGKQHAQIKLLMKATFVAGMGAANGRPRELVIFWIMRGLIDDMFNECMEQIKADDYELLMKELGLL